MGYRAPLLAAKCNACHQYTYDSIVADPGLTGNFDPNSAEIMMQAPTFNGIHAGGLGWNAADQTIIATWLEDEAEAVSSLRRAGSGEVSDFVATARSAQKTFFSCSFELGLRQTFRCGAARNRC